MKKKDGKFIDNKIVKEDHQEGIERVKQKDNKKMDDVYDGSLDKKGHANWKRGGSLTPRKA